MALDTAVRVEGLPELRRFMTSLEREQLPFATATALTRMASTVREREKGEIAQSFDGVEVMIDTGIMSGADIVAAIALGARFTLVGRAYLYGLMAGGRRGADKAIQILSDEIVRTMKLLGVRSLAELEPSHVTQLHT